MLEVHQLEIRRGAFRVYVENLEVVDRVVLLGPNGSGKSTLLRCLAGFIKPIRGRITLDGEDITHAKPSQRKIGYFPQEPFRIPLSPNKVMEYFRKRFGMDGEDIVEKMGLMKILDKKGLSLGESQIINLAILMMKRPRLLLLDEPASNLDFLNKVRLWQLLENISTPMVYVTHDPIEASIVGNSMYLIDGGTVTGPFPNQLKSKAVATITVFNLYARLKPFQYGA